MLLLWWSVYALNRSRFQHFSLYGNNIMGSALKHRTHKLANIWSFNEDIKNSSNTFRRTNDKRKWKSKGMREDRTYTDQKTKRKVNKKKLYHIKSGAIHITVSTRQIRMTMTTPFHSLYQFLPFAICYHCVCVCLFHLLFFSFFTLHFFHCSTILACSANGKKMSAHVACQANNNKNNDRIHLQHNSLFKYQMRHRTEVTSRNKRKHRYQRKNRPTVYVLLSFEAI